MGPSACGSARQRGSGRHDKRGGGGASLRGTGPGQASLPHLSRRATERRSEATSQWIGDHVRPERRYVPPGGPGFQKRVLRRVRKSVAQRYYHLFVRIRGDRSLPSRADDRAPEIDDERLLVVQLWEETVEAHLFTERKAWTPQIRDLWRRVGKDCGWEHPRAPALRWLWGDDAVGAVVELLESTRVGGRALAETARDRVDEDRVGEEVPGQERGGRARPALGCTFFFGPLSFVFLISFPFVGRSWGGGERGAPV